MASTVAGSGREEGIFSQVQGLEGISKPSIEVCMMMVRCDESSRLSDFGLVDRGASPWWPSGMLLLLLLP